jgi:hypothetical protein
MPLAGTYPRGHLAVVDFIPSSAPSGGGVQTVATYGAMGMLPSAAFDEGTMAWVQSGKALFVLEASTVGARTNVRIAASGKAGYQWVRVPVRNPAHEVQPAWFIDTGAGSDDASGTDSSHPLLTWNELALRLTNAEIAQTTTVTVTGDQKAGDVAAFTYNTRLLNALTFVGVPTVLYTSTVTAYTAASFGGGVAFADDNELTDNAVPGGSWTAAGALAKSVFIKRTNGTVIYAPVLKDLGGKVARIGQPSSATSYTTLLTFAPGDTYQLIKVPLISSVAFSSSTGNTGTFVQLFDWNVAANSTNGMQNVGFNLCYIEKIIRPASQAVALNGCCLDISAVSSFEAGSVIWSIKNTSFKGGGAFLYAFSGNINAESSTNSFQGATLIVENGIWNGGQLAFYDTTAPAFTTGTGARGHFVAPISGKGNTSKLLTANQSSQIVTTLVAASGGLWNAASTTDANPLQAGATSSATAIPLDANMNGIFATA